MSRLPDAFATGTVFGPVTEQRDIQFALKLIW